MRYNNSYLIVFLMVSLHRSSSLFHGFLIRIAGVCLVWMVLVFNLTGCFWKSVFQKVIFIFCLVHHCYFWCCLNSFCFSFAYNWNYCSLDFVGKNFLYVLWNWLLFANILFTFYYFCNDPICFAEWSKHLLMFD